MFKIEVKTLKHNKGTWMRSHKKVKSWLSSAQ